MSCAPQGEDGVGKDLRCAEDFVDAGFDCRFVGEEELEGLEEEEEGRREEVVPEVFARWLSLGGMPLGCAVAKWCSRVRRMKSRRRGGAVASRLHRHKSGRQL